MKEDIEYIDGLVQDANTLPVELPQSNIFHIIATW